METRAATALLTAGLRRFNRFHTRRMGLLSRRLLGGPLSLAQARLLFEIVSRPGCSASFLAGDLGMDKAQVSRILAQLDAKGLVGRKPGPSGRRAVPLHPTDKGRGLLRELERASDLQAEALAGHLDEKGKKRLLRALDDVERLLSEPGRTAPAIRVRPARSGDLGWIIMRHAAVYGAEFGFTGEFERYVLLGLAEYAQAPDAHTSRVWIGEADGAPSGSVGVVARPGGKAQLRWLLVEPHARRHGLGRALVRTAVDFARAAGHAELFLWTLKPLAPARKLYASMGFALAEEKRGTMGGKPMAEERWRLVLKQADEECPGPETIRSRQ